MLQKVKQRRVIIDLVECDMLEGLHRYKVRVSLVHPDRGVIQLIEACGASDQEYDQQSNDEGPISQVMPRAGVLGCLVPPDGVNIAVSNQNTPPFMIPPQYGRG